MTLAPYRKSQRVPHVKEYGVRSASKERLPDILDRFLYIIQRICKSAHDIRSCKELPLNRVGILSFFSDL